MALANFIRAIKSVFTIEQRLNSLEQTVNELYNDVRFLNRRIDHLNGRIDKIFEILLEIKENTDKK